MLKPFADDLWTSHQPLRFFGFQIGSRMTVVNLNDQGDLLVHSPIRLSQALVDALAARGTVKHVIAPNRWHHLSLGDFQAQYPQASFWCCPGLEKKRPDINFEGRIVNGEVYPWSDVLDHHMVGGCPALKEVVFLQRATQTLMVTDLGLHIGKESPWPTRWLFRMMGTYGKFGWTRGEKILFIKDRQAFGESIAHLLTWDFERIVLSHGRLVQNEGKARFQKAFGSYAEKV